LLIIGHPHPQAQENSATPDAAKLTAADSGSANGNVAVPPPSPPADWTVPDVDTLRDDDWGRTVRYGRELITKTYALIGPEVADASHRYSGNNLACASCHLEAGTKQFGLPFQGVYADFPNYRARSGAVGTIEDRINGCMTRSMNGRALPPDGPQMTAIVAYLKFLSTGRPVGTPTPGRGPGRMTEMTRAADPVLGKAIYAQTWSVGDDIAHDLRTPLVEMRMGSAAMADDIDRLRRYLGLDSIDLLGYSNGGATAQDRRGVRAASTAPFAIVLLRSPEEPAPASQGHGGSDLRLGFSCTGSGRPASCRRPDGRAREYSCPDTDPRRHARLDLPGRLLRTIARRNPEFRSGGASRRRPLTKGAAEVSNDPDLSRFQIKSIDPFHWSPAALVFTLNLRDDTETALSRGTRPFAGCLVSQGGWNAC
jgi:hypothetical protein